MGSEKVFENKIKKFLDEQGVYYIKHFANSYTKVGVPDILACVNSYFVGIEVKAANGKPSELQLYNLKKIHEAGGFGILLYPKDFDDFKTFIQMLRFNRYDAELFYRKRWVMSDAVKSQQGEHI